MYKISNMPHFQVHLRQYNRTLNIFVSRLNKNILENTIYFTPSYTNNSKGVYIQHAWK